MRRAIASKASKWLVTAGIVAVVFGLYIVSPVSAALQQQSITLSPASTPISLEPGGSQLNNISILNNGDTGYEVHVSTSPYHVVGVQYDPSFTQLQGTTDASAWVSVSKTTLYVPAHETVVIPYTLTIPANTAPGGYYAVIFVETTSAAGAGVQTHNRVGDVLYITARGKIREGGSLINIPIPHFTMASSIPLSVEVGNSGGVHFLTNVSFRLDNVFGKTVFAGSLERYVLPQTVRKVQLTWKTPAFGMYRVSRSATIVGRTYSVPQQWIVVIHPWVVVALVVLCVLIVATFFVVRYEKKAKQ